MKIRKATAELTPRLLELEPDKTLAVLQNAAKNERYRRSKLKVNAGVVASILIYLAVLAICKAFSMSWISTLACLAVTALAIVPPLNRWVRLSNAAYNDAVVLGLEAENPRHEA